MQTKLRTNVLVAVFGSCLVAVACSHDDTPVLTYGFGGQSASGGATALGGSTGGAAAGVAGDAGAAGDNGVAGNAGAAGDIGAAGNAGAAGCDGAAGCGNTCSNAPSTVSRVWTFGAKPAGWVLNPSVTSAATTYELTFGAPGSTLCSGGCALVTTPIAAGTPAGSGGALFNMLFDTPLDLVNATITASMIVVASPADAAVTWQLTALEGPPSYSGVATTPAPIATVADAKSFHNVVLQPSSSASFCAANVGAIGVRLTPSATPTTNVTVRLYIESISIAPASSSAGAGGAAGSSGLSAG